MSDNFSCWRSVSKGVLVAMTAFVVGAGLVAPVGQQPGSATNNQEMEWMTIPAGTFQMGCVPEDTFCASDELPAHRVSLTRAFQLMRTEVTVGQFRTSGVLLPPQPEWSTRAQQPVVSVTWGEARSFCALAGGRLPTEAEWE